MKKIIFAIMMASVLVSCHDGNIGEKNVVDDVNNDLNLSYGNDEDLQKRVSENVPVKPFEQISIAGSYHVYYTQGEKVSVRVEGRLGDLKRMVVTSDGETLRIKTKSLRKDLKSILGREMKEVKVYVSSPDLTNVSFAGSGEFEAQGNVDTDNLSIKLAGSGDIDFSQVICDDIEVDVAGSGDVEVKSIDVNNANISIAGSGDVEMHFVRADHVSAHVAGSGDIKLTGKAKQVEHRVAGSGDIDIANLQTGK